MNVLTPCSGIVCQNLDVLQLELGVYDAVGNFNIGRKVGMLIFEKVNMIIPGKYSLKGCQAISRKRLFASTFKNHDSTKRHRKIRRGKAKTKDDENEE